MLVRGTVAFVALMLLIGLAAPPSAAAATAHNARVAVLLLNFTSQPSEPWEKERVRSLFFGGTGSVAAYFAEVSNGQSNLTGDVFGYLTVKRSVGCAIRTWAKAARTRAAATGIDLSGYTNIVYLFPFQNVCRWNGFSAKPGSQGVASSWINGLLSTYVAVHELGHNFGLGHAGSLRCTRDGVRVAFSSTCAIYSYGDPFDVMGYGGTRHVHAWHRARLGFLAEQEGQIVTEGGIYRLGPAGEATDRPRLISIPRANGGFYHLELRRPFGDFDDFGPDADVVQGVSIRLAFDQFMSTTRLIDTTPDSCSFVDASLAAGRTFRDPINDVTVTTLDVGEAGAEVEIRFGAVSEPPPDDGGGTEGEPDVTPPSAVRQPAVQQVTGSQVAVSWRPATDDTGVLTYVVTVNGVERGRTCDVRLRGFTLAGGATYTVGVYALDAAGNAGPVESLNYTTPDFTSPTIARRLTAAVRGGDVALTWPIGKDNVAISFYRLNRNGRFLAEVPFGTKTYTDAGATRGSHRYTLIAFDAARNASRPIGRSVTVP